MELKYCIENKKVDISFIPVNFFSLENILKDFKVLDVLEFNVGLFVNEDEYINIDNLYKFIPAINSIENIIAFFQKINDREEFSVYKMKLQFEKFIFLYDDDSFVQITGFINIFDDYIFFNKLYSLIFSNYIENGYILDQ